MQRSADSLDSSGQPEGLPPVPTTDSRQFPGGASRMHPASLSQSVKWGHDPCSGHFILGYREAVDLRMLEGTHRASHPPL